MLTKSWYKNSTSFRSATNLSYYTKDLGRPTGTTWGTLNNDNDELFAAETEGEVFIQAGAGLVAKGDISLYQKND